MVIEAVSQLVPKGGGMQWVAQNANVCKCISHHQSVAVKVLVVKVERGGIYANQVGKVVA